jgi:hypothetical protein
MSDVVVRAPHLTEAALAHLAGRAVHVRSSPRHGCCGGAASVAVAEAGAPERLDGVERFEVSGTVVYVEQGLPGADGPWTIDIDGFARWRRLVVLGVDLSTR